LKVSGGGEQHRGAAALADGRPDSPSGGALPGTLWFDNVAGFNDYFTGFAFGSTLSFLVNFSGPAVTSPDGVSTSGSTLVSIVFGSQRRESGFNNDPNGFGFILVPRFFLPFSLLDVPYISRRLWARFRSQPGIFRGIKIFSYFSRLDVP
jgi:hypothetical protein